MRTNRSGEFTAETRRRGETRGEIQKVFSASSSASRRLRGECGSALLSVLWLSVALAAIAFALSNTVRGETERASTAAPIYMHRSPDLKYADQ